MRNICRGISCMLALGMVLLASNSASGDEMTLRVFRKPAWSAYLRNFEVHVNGKNIGSVANNTVTDFKISPIMPPQGGPNLLHFEFSTFGVLTQKSATVNFSGVDGDIVQAAFVSDVGEFPVEITFVGNPKAEKRQRLDKQEADYHAYVMGEKCLAPVWFCKNVRPSLAGFAEHWRDSFLAPLFQCQPVLRLLALCVLLYPIAGWLVYRAAKAEGTDPSWLPVGVPLIVLVLLIPLSWVVKIVVNLGAFAITGEDYYVPFLFAYFCLLALTLSAVLISSMVPLVTVTRHGMPMKRMLGVAGIVIECVSLLFLLRDVIGLVFSR
jgi:hypothetical protein